MRYFYNFLFYLALPIILLRLVWRARRQPAYLDRLKERLGFYPFTLNKCLWIHAASVGETIAAIPLIKALQEKYPQFDVLVTTMTLTGAERVEQVFGQTVRHVFIPYDFSGAVNRFVRAMRPRIAIILETELWPNLLNACKRSQIPVLLANARLSEKSAKGYRRIAPITSQMIACINMIAAQGQADANRFFALGAPTNKVSVTGSIKFDITVPEKAQSLSKELRHLLGDQRFVWIAASTHEGEEEQILKAQSALRQINAEALLILVPRHPERFDTVAKLAQRHFQVARRSRGDICSPAMGVYLGDTMGELLVLYGAADVAFVGGSLIERGGHNILEPAALAKPILSGGSMFNFAEIRDLFLQAQALTLVSDSESLVQSLKGLMESKEKQTEQGQRAFALMHANRGALLRQLTLVDALLTAEIPSG